MYGTHQMNQDIDPLVNASHGNVTTPGPDGRWVAAEPVKADPKVWTDYWEGTKRDGSKMEGIVPRWRRFLGRVLFGEKWKRV